MKPIPNDMPEVYRRELEALGDPKSPTRQQADVFAAVLTEVFTPKKKGSKK